MKKVIKKILTKVITIAIAVSLVLFCLSRCGFFLKSAERVEAHDFIIDGERYLAMSVAFTEEGRKIAKAETFDIMEIPEDKEHNFLAVRSFLDNWTIVKESYVIPTEGEVGVVFLGRHERVTRGIKWNMVQSILNEDFDGEFVVKGKKIVEDCGYVSDVTEATEYIFVGYEDCPVGTDVIGKFGIINRKLVFIKDEELIEEDLKYTCYILKEEYYALFKDRFGDKFCDVIRE